MVARVSFKDAQGHHKNSEGGALLNVESTDGIISTIKPAELVVLVCSNGRVLFIETESFRKQQRGTKGRPAMNIGNGEIIAALSLNGELLKPVEQIDAVE